MRMQKTAAVIVAAAERGLAALDTATAAKAAVGPVPTS